MHGTFPSCPLVMTSSFALVLYRYLRARSVFKPSLVPSSALRFTQTIIEFEAKGPYANGRAASFKVHVAIRYSRCVTDYVLCTLRQRV